MVSPAPLTFTWTFINPVAVAVNLNQTLLLGPLLQQVPFDWSGVAPVVVYVPPDVQAALIKAVTLVALAKLSLGGGARKLSIEEIYAESGPPAK